MSQTLCWCSSWNINDRPPLFNRTGPVGMVPSSGGDTDGFTFQVHQSLKDSGLTPANSTLQQWLVRDGEYCCKQSSADDMCRLWWACVYGVKPARVTTTARGFLSPGCQTIWAQWGTTHRSTDWILNFRSQSSHGTKKLTAWNDATFVKLTWERWHHQWSSVNSGMQTPAQPRGVVEFNWRVELLFKETESDLQTCVGTPFYGRIINAGVLDTAAPRSW